MQSTTYRPVPYAIGGVAYPRPAPVEQDPSAPIKQFGAEDSNGFRPVFFTSGTQGTDAEAQLRLDWEQAAAKMIAKAYSHEFPATKGALVDLAV